MGSNRLPGKPLKELSKHLRLLESVYQRVEKSGHFRPGDVYFLTSENKNDDQLQEFFEQNNWKYFRGDETRVFFRYYHACRLLGPKYFFRICADNPFLEPAMMDELVNFTRSGYDYISYMDPRGIPAVKTHYGIFAELVSGKAILELDPSEVDTITLEHVTPMFYDKESEFNVKYVDIPEPLVNENVRLTVDTVEDLAIARKLFQRLPKNFTVYDIYQVLERNPQLLSEMSLQIIQNKK